MFVIEICDNDRQDLLDFDFIASSNELLQKINICDNSAITEFTNICKKSNDFDIIQQIISFNNQKKNDIAKSLYNRLQPSSQLWFSENFKF